MITKDERQQLAATKWRNSRDSGSTKNGNGCWHFVTGFGKTYGTINYVFNPMFERNSQIKIIVLVCRVSHYKQWIEETKKIVSPNYINNITIYTVQNLIANNITNLDCDLLVVDELHKFTGEEYLKYIDGTNIKSKYQLGLTATYPKDNDTIKKLYPVIDKITQEEAIQNGWIANFIEFNLPVQFTTEEQEAYTEKEKLAHNLLSKFGKYGFDAVQKIIQGGFTDNKQYTGEQYAKMWATKNGWVQYPTTEEQKALNEIWNPKQVIGYAHGVRKAFRERDEILHTAVSKIHTTLSVIDKLNTKTIVFSQSTKFADALAFARNKQKTDCVVYHTALVSRPLQNEKGEWIVNKTGKKAGEKKLFGVETLKKLALDSFKNNESLILSTAKALDENYDCPDIRLGIITSRSKDTKQQVQRGGRVKRLIPNNPNDIMVIVNLYIPMTKDYDNLVESQKDSTNKIYWIKSVDEITTDFEQLENGIDIDEL